MGNNPFKNWVKSTFAHQRFTAEVPASRELAYSPEQLISFVCEYFDVTKEQLCVSRRGKENVQRDLAILIVRQYTRETLAAIGCYFGIDKYNTVSSTVERIKTRAETGVSEINDAASNGPGEHGDIGGS